MEHFRNDERKQLENAWRNFRRHTRSPSSDDDADELDETEELQTYFQSKLQLFRMFLRTQSIDIRHFGIFHRDNERIFLERLFYLVLNHVELTNFSTFNFYSIISLSKELEKYQESTRKLISNSTKLNGIIQFVLSFSPSTVSTFHLNNLFYLLINDMNDLSGKIIDRFADLLRSYHFMTYGFPIRKQTMISIIDYNVHSANFANPIIYPLYENFLNSSYVYKGPFIVSKSSTKHRISLYTMIQNLAILLLGFTVEDFDTEEDFLLISSEHCYQIRLTIRHFNYLYLKYHFKIEYPVENLDKQIILHLMKLIIKEEKSFDSIRRLLEKFFELIYRFSESKVKNLLYQLLSNRSLEFHSIETIRYFLDFNRSNDDDDDDDENDEIWLNDEQIRLLTHRHYSREIFSEIFVPLINGDVEEKRSINEILTYLDENLRSDVQPIDIEEMKTILTIRS